MSKRQEAHRPSKRKGYY